MLTLSPVQRRELRARAHTLHPVVSIGHAGLTPAVLHEIDVALNAHELVKVRAHAGDRDERDRFHDAICTALDAAPVQHLGKLLIVWRPKPEAKATEKERRRTPGQKAAARRGGAPASSKDGKAGNGPPEPSIGARARKHRRGASRHAPDARGSGKAAPNARRRTSQSRAAEPAVPTTSAPRGARYLHGKPAGPRSRKKPGESASGPRPPRAAPSAGAPAAVRRRRRTAGGH